MKHRKKWAAATLLLFCALVFHHAWCVPSVAARGTVAGFSISTSVDGPLARAFLQGEELPPDLVVFRAQLERQNRIPTSSELERISRRHSPDVATLLLLDRLSQAPGAAQFRERFEQELLHVRTVGVENTRLEIPPHLTILMVPGWFYEENGHETNADYRIQRSLLSRWKVPHRLVPIDQNGTVETNALEIAHAIRALPTGERAFLVSASKSGGEVALALGGLLSPSDAARVQGWLSIGGVVGGSVLADRVLEPDICWFVRLQLAIAGFDMEGLKSMATSRRRVAFRELAFPLHWEIYSYIPVPLSGQISSRGEIGYRLMRSRGPNDGLTLLTDELVPGATPILAPGVDHFLGSPDEQLILGAALFRAILGS